MDRCNDNTPFTKVIEDVTDRQAEQLRLLADAQARVVVVDDIRQLELELFPVAV